ncbi:MAG: hypothetical protein JJLCMIEE_02747 [Acidimicrobiales bacterium]|nr:MAG: branched-chain amino acid ABC transporter permease [Actinomycetota bacterium]MBV6509651.1 hypothetical protein [Acidimicrobiales bacterium]RIK06343.1 MAG: branched-chain amino acid ABC transporter permease [Acidobacteriota bacterium]
MSAASWAVEKRPTLVKVGRWVGWIGIIAVGLYLPQAFPPFRVGQFNTIMAYGLAALGLALLTGFNGQISIGHGAFFGIGAYTTVIIVGDHPEFPWLATTAVGALLAFAVGIVVGLPALRIRGLYLGVVTLALALLFRQALEKYSDLTGGSQGRGVPRGQKFSAPDWTGLANDQWRYYVIFVIVVGCLVLSRNIVKSRMGRAAVAIRDNETAAEVLGVNVARTKVLMFGVSAMLAGIGGSLLVIGSPIPRVSANSFTIVLSITFLVALVVGGATSILGPIIGAAFVVLLPEVVPHEQQVLTPVILGAVLIALMLVAPDGVVGLSRRSASWAWRMLARAADTGPDTGLETGDSSKEQLQLDSRES